MTEKKQAPAETAGDKIDAGRIHAFTRTVLDEVYGHGPDGKKHGWQNQWDKDPTGEYRDMTKHIEREINKLLPELASPAEPANDKKVPKCI